MRDSKYGTMTRAAHGEGPGEATIPVGRQEQSIALLSGRAERFLGRFPIVAEEIRSGCCRAVQLVRGMQQSVSPSFGDSDHNYEPPA
jgi:hypothetical protein